ncbi:MAG: hypothetical protein ACREHF_14045 [Rhizomicrobium sp.]
MRLRLSGDTATSPRAIQAQGLVCSLLLHGLFAALVVFLLVRPRPPEIPLARFLPVDLVQPAPQATAPPARRNAAAAQAHTRPAHAVPSSPRRPVALAPARKRPPPDALEIRLKQLALLRQPDSSIAHPDNGASDEAANENSESPGGNAYRVRDYLRAQVERRWGVDLSRAHDVTVRIRVVVAKDGTVTKAEIVDRARYARDTAWRSVALSARNAVLLSSPLALPAGPLSAPLDVILALNPKDALR